MAEQKRFYLGAVAILLLGSAFHSLYELLGRLPIVAIFFAVNESVWEHLKLLSTAAFLWMVVDWRLAGKEGRLRYFAARATALPLAMLTIPLSFYLFESALDIENVVLSIGIFLLAAVFYQWFALRLESRLLASAQNQAIGIAVLAGIFLLFAVFTFLPPRLPIFLDKNTGSYGIPK